MSRPVIEPARSEDRQAVEDLLSLCGLPLDGVRDHFARFLVAREPVTAGVPVIVGCAGLEVHGPVCVFRSLAVRPGARRRGTGRALIEAALDRARGAGCTDVYLLTYTIERMATHMGFVPIARDNVPPEARAGSEFTINACASAAVMHRAL